VANCNIESGLHVEEDYHIRAIWLALNASYALEAFRFMVSFATSLAMVENKIFIGNGNIIQLILQDEILTQRMDWMVDQSSGQRRSALCSLPRQNVKPKCIKCMQDVIREEKAWADYLFNKGPVIGLNANILKDFVDLHSIQCTQRDWHQVHMSHAT
jgi:ribonucleoside-diphosphate reductase beta chain